MHVVLVTTSYPEAKQGSEAAGGFVADFAQELARHIDVSVVAATTGRSESTVEGKVTVHRFAVIRYPLSLLRPHRPADWWPIIKSLRDGRRALEDAISGQRPDYVFALWALPAGYWARVMQRRHGVPYGIWSLGSDIWGLGRVPVVRQVLRRVLSDATHRFADGFRLASEVESICGQTCDFLPSARFMPKSKSRSVSDSPPYRLAFLGRWHTNKGVDLFLDALARLGAEDWSKIEGVRVYGGGPLEKQVHQQVEQLRSRGLPVEVGGFLGIDDATALLNWSDYVVLPSRVESVPVIFSDAAQLQRPLVATPVGDLPMIFKDNEFGVMAAAASVDEFASALKRALALPATKFADNLTNIAGRFDVAESARRMAETFDEVME